MFSMSFSIEDALLLASLRIASPSANTTNTVRKSTERVELRATVNGTHHHWIPSGALQGHWLGPDEFWVPSPPL